MRLIDRYVFRELASHALLGLAVFTFVFFVPQLVRLMDIVVRHWSNVGTLALLILCALPGVFSFSLPIAVLVGALIGLGRLGADGEIVALNSLGVSRRHLLVPVALFAVAGGLVTLANTVWLGPRALGELKRLESHLLSSETSIDIEPRVFQEEFSHFILYVEDASPSGRQWRGVFLAETGPGGNSEVTLASRAVLVPRPGSGTLQLHLERGATHTYDPGKPNHYTVATFASSDLALRLAGASGKAAARPPPAEQTIGQLLRARGPSMREAQVELQRRFAFPVACLVFALLAVGVGARPRRNGRALGFVLTLLLLAGYYLVFVVGVGKARQGTLPVWLGVWLANIVCATVGAAMAAGLDGAGNMSWAERVSEWLAGSRRRSKRRTVRAGAVSATAGPGRRMARFPLLMDLYIIRSFAFYFLLSLGGFVLLIEIFTFFELLNDISRHLVAASVVASYFVYLAPLLLYELTPLAALVGTLVALAVMNKYNEVTALKASGVSLYRISLPLVAVGLLLSAGLFAMDAGVLPYANRKQDGLRNRIKGLPAQTYFQPRLHWVFGQGEQIYNYELFDADQRLFAGLNVLELDPTTFQIRRRVYARQAHWDAARHDWVLDHGWVRDFRDNQVVRYQPFTTDSLPEIDEPPGYFRRQVLQSYQMNWRQLGEYIGQLRQAGFDVARLSVEWERKFAFPLMAAIIILIGIPFPFLVGARGAVGGLAAGVGIGIVYWASSALFEAMGTVGQLPPVVAGWAPDAIFFFVGLYLFLKMPT
ncbi:MAG TPA: LPS export ABC transporter permease LptF [Patescibacteria group bacterium]|nr:LPS export ABC transporter permease LptF [Patescibacteria group bacterium]